MALPIAHATAGWLLHRLDRRETRFTGWTRATTYMAVANLPDADFLLGFVLGTPGTFHRGVSHTLLAALVFGLLAGAVLRWCLRDRWLPASAMLAAVYASHLLVDALTIDARGPAGAQFLWPLSAAYYIAPVTFFGEILIDGTSRLGFLATVLAPQTLPVLLHEAAVAVAVVAAVTLAAGRRTASEGRAPALGLAPEAGEEDCA